MSTVFDGQAKVLITNANTPDYVGNTRYAISPVFPPSVPYHYLKTVAGSITFKGRSVVTGIVTEMTAGEKAAVDVAELAAAKPARKAWLKLRGDAYTDERYTSDTQEKLHALYMDALRYRPKRMQYLQPWIDWLDKINEEIQSKQTAVEGGSTADAVNAIVLNEASLTSQDPGITIDGANAVVDTMDLQPFVDANAEVTDTPSGKKGPFHLMQTLLLREDMYGDTQNPVHVPGRSTPVLGGTGWAADHANRILNVEVIHGKLGWHAQQVQQALYSRPKDMMIYYGYPNSFNSGTNGWVNEKVAQDLARYGIIVLGDGVEDPSHPDYANTQVIIPRIKALNPQAKIFGYVDTTLVIATFQTKVGQWDALSVHGIFMDKAGYDWGTIRADFNTRVDYIHARPAASLVFANCWNTDHVLGIANDVSFPNTTFNVTLTASKLTSTDWVLLESCPVNTAAYSGTGNDGYEVKTDWIARVQKAINLRALYGVNFAAAAIILDAHANGQALFNFHFIAALMANLDAMGASDVSYGSGSAKGKWWTRSDVNGLGIVWQLYPAIQLDAGDADVYERFVEAATLKVDFSGSGAQISSITKR